MKPTGEFKALRRLKRGSKRVRRALKDSVDQAHRWIADDPVRGVVRETCSRCGNFQWRHEDTEQADASVCPKGIV